MPSDGRAVGHLMRHVEHAVHVLSPRHQVSGDVRELRRLHSLDVTLGVAKPGDDAGDPVGQVRARRLELLGELADEHALARQEAERVDADQRLDPAHPDPIDDSPRIFTRPSWPDLSTCVPPHSSRE